MPPPAVQLAETLPPRLLRFFQRFPPPALTPNRPVKPSQIPVVASTTSSADPNAPALESATPEAPLSAPVEPELPYHNPFQPRKNYRTGKWHGPVYGLRQQADLVKVAQKYGVLDLLPYTIKKPGEKEKRRIERGLMVKGTGVGQKVKGKLWERTLKGRLDKRREAMLNMPALIQEWKQKGHGRGWKKWPK
ncbi:hypothetical protein BU24DRAFT_451688 [Aaosphaeria arxii CBS 175.79]|uniref:Large ribosomal subunit protein mL59 domain-containing protein n=1 Tax=Aaosphaeria arxii CBS 175.79 TaxID=1450172 RepID=A0A6A5XP98_9PLEO|nr:uncharacterized protein BU24DRAFT_451688 [Aaosphaeria arxii CBS 175.79]KAF2014726.1 hypothetical protein BU24DRAFT_451688 [Aaosphaeria arxii CBS 175.79]